MPDQNSDPTASPFAAPNTGTPFAPIEPVIPPIEAPPLPSAEGSDLPPAPPIIEQPGEAPPGSAAPSFDITTAGGGGEPKKKFGGKKVIATILGLLVLVGGLGAGIILVQQQQDIRQRASIIGDGGGGGGTPTPTQTPTATRVPTPPTATPTQTPSPTSSQSGLCPRDCIAPKSKCTPGTFYPSESQSLGYGDCGAALGEYCCNASSGTGTPTPPPTATSAPATTCTLTGSEICVGNDPTGDCYQGGQGNKYACYKLKGNPGKKISGSTNCTCPAPYTWGPRQEYGSPWCFNTAISNCTPSPDTRERCSLQPQQCPSSTPTPTVTQSPGGGVTAQCFNVRAFDTNWVELTTSELAKLTAGDKVRFTIGGNTSSGSFDKAKFKINGIERPEVTGKKPSSQDFFDEYTIPTGVTTFTINAQIHHSTLGWSK